MLRQQKSPGEVVNAHEIELAASGKGRQIAVEQHDGHPRLM